MSKMTAENFRKLVEPIMDLYIRDAYGDTTPEERVKILEASVKFLRTRIGEMEKLVTALVAVTGDVCIPKKLIDTVEDYELFKECDQESGSITFMTTNRVENEEIARNSGEGA